MRDSMIRHYFRLMHAACRDLPPLPLITLIRCFRFAADICRRLMLYDATLDITR